MTTAHLPYARNFVVNCDARFVNYVGDRILSLDSAWYFIQGAPMLDRACRVIVRTDRLATHKMKNALVEVTEECN